MGSETIRKRTSMEKHKGVGAGPAFKTILGYAESKSKNEPLQRLSGRLETKDEHKRSIHRQKQENHGDNQVERRGRGLGEQRDNWQKDGEWGTDPHRERGRRQEHRSTKLMGDLSVSLARKWPRGVARRRN